MSFSLLVIVLLICHSSSMNLERLMLGSRHSIGSFCLVGRKIKRARHECLFERKRFVIFMHRIFHIKNASNRTFLLTETWGTCTWHGSRLKLRPGWGGSPAVLQRDWGAGEIKEESQNQRAWSVSGITLWRTGDRQPANLNNCQFLSGLRRKKRIHLEREGSLMR